MQYTPTAEEDIRHFDEKGYLIVRGVLNDDEIGRLTEASDRLVASDIKENRQPSGNGRTDGFRNVVTLDDAFIPLLTQPKILPLVVHLLGAQLQLMTSHLIYKYPDPPDTPASHRAPGWHRDYLQAMMALGHYSIPRIELKCAYYFTDLSEKQSGCTMVAPGSNLLKEPMVIPEGQVDPEGAVEPSLQPGDCLLFENRTWHAGSVNLSERTRKGVMIGYGYRWVVPMDFRRQEASFVEKLSPLERYLVGEAYDDVKEFQPNGGANPLADWCKEHGVPTARHAEAGGTVKGIL